MILKRHIPGCGSAIIIVPRDTEARLLTRCFRGTELALAGNFHRWASIGALLNTPIVLDQLLEDIKIAWLEKLKKNSVEIECDLPVGWASTAKREKFSPKMLREYRPTNRCRGLIVRSDAHVLAPQTSILTIVYDLVEESEQVQQVIIRSVYPGENIGELRGDVTEREGCVFFAREHPGSKKFKAAQNTTT